MFATKVQHKLKELTFIVLFWVMALSICVFIKFNDLREQDLVAVYHLENWISKPIMYKMAVFYGLGMGLVFGLLQTFLYPFLIKTQTFIMNLLLRALIFGVLFFIIIYGVLFLYNGRHFITAHSPLGSPGFLRLLGSLFICSIVVQIFTDFILQMRKNMGPGYLSNIIRGRYHRPREESRAFMFLDLASSTSIAEKMGHLMFSRFLQDCFKDLSAVLLDYDARIYQFVGDEAVLSWQVNPRFNREKCLLLYFAYQERIAGRERYYLQQYGCLPLFRAALHEGQIMVAAVGEIKSEIAYHGDVLNTASRVQALCKTHDALLLITGNIYSAVKDSKKFSFLPIPPTPLQGKKTPIDIYSARLSNAPL